MAFTGSETNMPDIFTALVTGATGFVGSAVTRLLLREGFKIRVLVRPGSDRRNLSGLDVEIIEGDLLDDMSLRKGCEGCDAVFHVAADYRLWVPKPAEIYRANVEGTRKLLSAVLEAGVPRVVYTSSVAVLGIPDGGVGDETTPVELDDMIGHYKRSKFLAQRVAEDFSARGLDVVIVNPSTPIGPRDIKPTPTGRIVRDAAAGRIPAYVDTGLNIAHVDDIAMGHVLAYRRGKSGRCYVLGGADMTLEQILTQIAEIVGRKAPTIRLPHAAVLPVAYISEGFARVFGGTPVATVDEVRMSKKKMFFSWERARKELGYAPREARLAIEDAVRWFNDNKLNIGKAHP